MVTTVFCRSDRKARWQRCRCGCALIWLMAAAAAQTCQSAADMDAAVRTALETTARRYFDMAAHGDSAGLQQNAIPSLAASFWRN